MLADAFSQIAMEVSAAFGGPYHKGRIEWAGAPEFDDGGSLIPGEPECFECMVQIDGVTDAMRREAGYLDKDIRLIVLAPGLSKPVDLEASVTVLDGPHGGSWKPASVNHDTLGFAYDGRGRKA